MKWNKQMAALSLVCLAACGAAGAADKAPVAPGFVYSPYKLLDLHREGGATSSGALTLAFATGECGAEVWGQQSAQEVAAGHAARLAAAGVDYIISTGGQGGVFTCGSDAGMERFLARYASPRLLGIDFDIEAGQTAEQIDSLVQRAATAQRKRPGLRVSFTVATHAASDGSKKSLNAMGESILAAVRRSALKNYTFNLMVMDYGPPDAASCVVREGVCDMGRSAIQAVRNVNEKHGIPLRQLEVTAMIGLNDMPANDFTVVDARVLAGAVRSMRLAGLHFWSQDRDTPCPGAISGASGICNGLPGVPAGAYSRAFQRALAPRK
jgi:hypothetical protein